MDFFKKYKSQLKTGYSDSELCELLIPINQRFQNHAWEYDSGKTLLAGFDLWEKKQKQNIWFFIIKTAVQLLCLEVRILQLPGMNIQRD